MTMDVFYYARALVSVSEDDSKPPASDTTILLWFFMVLLIVSLVALIRFRFNQQKKAVDPSGTSLTRPLLAMLLVGAVILLAAASLGMTESDDVQKLLIGALISLSSAAAAFFFASSNATEARKDLLAFNGDWITAPSFENLTVGQAKSIAAVTNFSLKLQDPPPADSAIIESQTPAAGTQVRRSQEIAVTTAKTAGAEGSII